MFEFYLVITLAKASASDNIISDTISCLPFVPIISER